MAGITIGLLFFAGFSEVSRRFARCENQNEFKKDFWDDMFSSIDKVIPHY